MKKLYPLFICFLPFLIQGQTTFFVNQALPSSGIGTSWSSAYTNLHTALQKATYGDQIWVAQGTYKTTDDSNRDSTFLLKNGIQLFGGFAGNEISIKQRNLAKNTTIIDGNIGTLTDSLDNSYTLLFLENCDTTAIVDGFTFQNGNANSDKVEDLFYGRQKCGGALYIEASNGKNGSPIIRNCVFKNNNAWFSGGAIYYNSRNDGVNALRIYDCIFFNNKSQSQGGAIHIQDLTQYPNIENKVEHCTFNNNYAFSDGGALYITNNYSNFELKINKCNFTANNSLASGSAINISNITKKTIKITIDSCNFDKESSIDGNCIALVDQLGAYLSSSIRYSNFKNNNFKAYVLYFFLGKSFKLEHCNFIKNNASELIDATLNSLELSHCFFLSNNVSNIKDRLLYLTKVELSATNCIFANHKNTVFYFVKYKTDTTKIEVNNCLFFNNKQILNLANIQSGEVTYGKHRFNNCIFQANNLSKNSFFTGNGPIETNNSIFDASNCDSLLSATLGNTPVISCHNSIFNTLVFSKDTLLTDFALPNCSPAINAGANIFVTNNNKIDFIGKPRIQYNKVDVGPYEYQDFRQINDTTYSAWCGKNNGHFSLGCVNACLPLNYEWTKENGQKGTGNTDLGAGNYVIVVSDKQGCKDTVALNIGVIQALNASFIIANASNPNANNGSIQIVNVVNGTPPFNVMWSNGALGSTATKLLPGDYTVTITDANGCSFSETNTVSYSIATQETEKEGLMWQLSPNPQQAYLPISIKTNQLEGVGNLIVYNLLGQKIETQRIDFSSMQQLDLVLPKGVFLLQLQCTNRFYTKKILVD